MTPERWNYLKALRPQPGRYLHISCIAEMIPDPAYRGSGIAPLIPFVCKGTSYYAGRNKAKRARREIRNQRMAAMP